METRYMHQSLQRRQHEASALFLKTDGKSSENTFDSHIYEGYVPGFAADLLEKLYQNIYCTVTRLALYGSLSDTSTYVAMDGEIVDAVILFRINDKMIEVLNQQIELSTAQIARFCSAVFEQYPGVCRVEFFALNTTVLQAEFPYVFQEVPRIEENIAYLPPTQDEYLEKMRPETRGRIKKNIRKIKSHFPTYHVEFFVGDAIRIEHIRELVRLADLRMASKDSEPYISNDEIDAMAALARTHGCAAIVFIDGRICGGTLTFQVGHRYFSRMIAHDPAFNVYGLGNQVQLLIMLYCIEHGGTQFWMMGGGVLDKARFLTERKMLNSITVYRSRTSALQHWRTFARNATRQTMFRSIETIKQRSAEPSPSGRACARLWHAVSTAKVAYRRVRSRTIARIGRDNGALRGTG